MSHHQTQLLHADDPGAIDTVAQFLRHGQLVVFPTDTVYGIGADAFNAEAIISLYVAKQRPSDKGIPILLADLSDLAKVSRHLPPIAQAYIEAFWPGQLTLVVPRHADVPDILSPDDTVAVRIPDSHVARAVIRAAGGVVATSSANISTHPAAQTAVEALHELDGCVTAVLDNGPSPHAIASTIVDCTGPEPRILRHGPITAEQLQRIGPLSL